MTTVPGAGWATGRLAEELGETFYGPPTSPNTRRILVGGEHARRRGPDRFRAHHEAAVEAIWQAGVKVGRTDRLLEVGGRAGLGARPGRGWAERGPRRCFPAQY
jgi:2-hydroxychromene-2-carboxylate isomerase